MIRAKAEQVANDFRIEDFKVNGSFLHRWKERSGLLPTGTTRQPKDEFQPVPSLSADQYLSINFSENGISDNVTPICKQPIYATNGQGDFHYCDGFHAYLLYGKYINVIT